MERILEDISKWPIEKREKKLKELYEERIGRKLNLEDPQYFTEKIQCIKLYYHDPLMTQCVDKRSFKKYIERKMGGIAAKLYFSWDSPAEVDLSELPKQCVIKSNCSGDGNYIIIVRDKSELNLEQIEKQIKGKWFDRRYLHTNSFANAYYGVKPCVIVEEYLSGLKECVDEFKFYCFHGVPKVIYAATNHFKESKNVHDYPISFYTTDWKYMGVKYGNYVSDSNVERPLRLEEMLEISKTLSEDFEFVRVDFFDTPSKLYVAELTFTPGAGLTPYHPGSFDYEMGQWLTLNENKMQR